MRQRVLFVIFVIVFAMSNSIANASQLELKFSSTTMSCQEKKELFNSMDKTQMQRLFSNLGYGASGRAILTMAKYRNDLMNQAFIQYENHPWSNDDMRVLQLVRAIWAHSLDPICFDQNATGFSSEEWLLGMLHGLRVAKENPAKLEKWSPQK